MYAISFLGRKYAWVERKQIAGNNPFPSSLPKQPELF
jgi:hypothetical protein